MTEAGIIRVVGLGGSLAEDSTSLAALNIALDGAVEAGAQVEIFDLRELDLPMYSREIPAPPGAVRLAEAAYMAHGMIWSSPLYHGTISGAFKNALDWLDLLRGRTPPFLTDKIIGLVSTAGGVHGLQAINTMEYVVRSLRAWTVPLVMPIPQSWQTFDENGRLRDEKMEAQLKKVGSEVYRAACQVATHGHCDYSTTP